VSALGTPFVLEGLFGEADADAIDVEPDSELAAGAMGMDIEDDVEGPAATTNGGMILDGDSAANNISTLCVFQPTNSRLETVKKVYRTVVGRKRKRARSPDTMGTSGLAVLEETEFDTEMGRVPKRLRRIAVRSASHPTAQSLCAVRALSGKRGGSASGRCCIRPLEELGGCRLTVNS
jgi:hypothetical protein